MLTAGTYTVEVTADDCELLSKEITVSADIATHTQAFELAYKSADYTELDKAEKAAKALNKDDYEDFSEVEKALAAIDRTKNITEQADVDAMVKAINDAVANLVKKAPASSQPDSSTADSKTDKLKGGFKRFKHKPINRRCGRSIRSCTSERCGCGHG